MQYWNTIVIHLTTNFTGKVFFIGICQAHDVGGGVRGGAAEGGGEIQFLKF